MVKNYGFVGFSMGIEINSKTLIGSYRDLKVPRISPI
jgi:hypothetical protein